MQKLALKTLGLTLALVGLTACQKHEGQTSASEQPAVIQPSVAPSTDAYPVAKDIYQFLLQAEPILTSKPTDFQKQIFDPVQQLLQRWQLEIKQSDSVIGDQLMICRGALLSFDSWARSVQDNSSSQVDKESVYKNQKQLCANMLQSRQTQQ